MIKWSTTAVRERGGMVQYCTVEYSMASVRDGSPGWFGRQNWWLRSGAKCVRMCVLTNDVRSGLINETDAKWMMDDGRWKTGSMNEWSCWLFRELYDDRRPVGCVHPLRDTMQYTVLHHWVGLTVNTVVEFAARCQNGPRKTEEWNHRTGRCSTVGFRKTEGHDCGRCRWGIEDALNNKGTAVLNLNSIQWCVVLYVVYPMLCFQGGVMKVRSEGEST